MGDSVDTNPNMFEETRALLRGKISAAEWTDHASLNDWSDFGAHAHVIHHNLEVIACGRGRKDAESMAMASRVADAVSLLAQQRHTAHLLGLGAVCRHSMGVREDVPLRFPKRMRSALQNGTFCDIPRILQE